MADRRRARRHTSLHKSEGVNEVLAVLGLVGGAVLLFSAGRSSAPSTATLESALTARNTELLLCLQRGLPAP